MTVALFVYIKAGIEGNPAAILPFLQAKLIPTLLAGYSFWPVVNIGIFRFVPQVGAAGWAMVGPLP